MLLLTKTREWKNLAFKIKPKKKDRKKEQYFSQY